MIVAIAPGLLQEDHLVDAAVLESFEMRPHVVGRADARGSGADLFERIDHRRGTIAALLDIMAPKFGAAGNAILRDQRVERVAEELKTLVAAADRFGAIAMDGKTRHHRQ